MPLQPKLNDDDLRKQVALRVIACLVNHLGTRRICLTEHGDFAGMQCTHRQLYGYCGVNCNLCHSLSSTLAMLALNLRTHVDDTIHWPRQNYEKDHKANIRGP